ncbi:nucleoside triphosphate pyrophosphohydrolase [Neobacillus sp. 179-J 1A1 HS]|uniref:phosphoribosyl-ATP pyrophosphohydrolase n=1 Tax=Neobacillus driksii TaxID=3035913 RepID=UPI0035BBE3A1
MIVYNKLVRDKIPQIIESTGKKATFSILDDENYKHMLDKKLYEELEEYGQERDINELADLVEVVYAIVEQQGFSIEEFENIRIKKKEKRGGFKDKLLLLEVDEGK